MPARTLSSHNAALPAGPSQGKGKARSKAPAPAPGRPLDNESFNMSKNARAVALKQLDLYRKWKKAVTPSASASTSAEAADGAAEAAESRDAPNALGLFAAGDEPGQDGEPGAENREEDENVRLTRLTREDALVRGSPSGSQEGSEEGSVQGGEDAEADEAATGKGLSAIEELHREAMKRLLPTLLADLGSASSSSESPINNAGSSGSGSSSSAASLEARIRAFLSDRATLFRFYRRSRYDVDGALEMLHTTLSWRLRTGLDLCALETLHSTYVYGPGGEERGEEVGAAAAARGAGEEEQEEDGGGEADSPASGPGSGTPLFWLSDRFVDRYGRPCGVISLRSLERVSPSNSSSNTGGSAAEALGGDSEASEALAAAAEGQGSETEGVEGKRGLSEVKEYIVASMEITRKYLEHAYRRFVEEQGGIDNLLAALSSAEDESEADEESMLTESARFCPPLQMTIAFDLGGSGMANLELELLPFLLDLLKNHFPGMVGAVYVLHFGWLHSGMWTIAKRVLPQQALARIFFPSDKELRSEHFAPANLPRELGGEWPTRICAESNVTMRRFGRRAAQAIVAAATAARASKQRAASRSASANASAAQSRAQSSANTPLQLSPALPVTARMSGPAGSSGSASSLRAASTSQPSYFGGASSSTEASGQGQGFDKAISRTQSFESIYDVFYSADVTVSADV